MSRSYSVATYTRGSENAEKLALVLPGLFDTKDYPHMRSHVDFLAGLGFYAISFDMPGTWESGDDTRDFTTTNCLAVIDDFIVKFDKPTFVFGHSNGGRLAVLAAMRNPKIFAVASAMSAATTYTAAQIAQWKDDGVKISWRDLPEDASRTREFKLPFSFCEDAQQPEYDARAGLPGLTIPKLFVAGRYDTLVTPAEINATYQLAAVPKSLVIASADHDYRRDPAAIAAMNQVVGDFLATSQG